MDNAADDARLRDYLKRVTAELSQARQRLHEVESSKNEPIAIVGMSCHYPGGVETPEDLWDLVAQGRDGVTDFPRDRGWDLETVYDPTGRQPGTTYSREAGFLSDAAGFDAEFFGISEAEALVMDPQQRLMLEAAWEAAEHAGIDPTSLRGTNTGVFCGAMSQDYAPQHAESAEDVKDNLMIGNSVGILSGRIAYCLGLTGPAITVDTTSSSSLTALHLAVRALRAGDCETVLSGGVSVIATPAIFTEHSRSKKLSPTGRSRSFAEAADGMNLAEGVGVLVLERLSTAHRHGRRVLAVIRGSGVNNSGTSNGLTAPSTPSAEDVFHRALADARLDPSDVDLVEAHATGTVLSAPIEAQALKSVYGRERSPGNPLYLGTMKSNFGHSQAAAGVGGVIKMVLAMRHGLMPKTLHVDAPTSQFDWSAGTLRLLTDSRPWPATDRPRRAGVSSFGLSGTNCHLLLEEAPQPPDGEAAPAEDRGLSAPVVLWPLSGKTEAALRGQAAKLLSHIESRDELAASDVGWSLAATRPGFTERAVVAAADRDGFTHGLRALRDGEHAPQTLRRTCCEGALAFLFTGPSGGRAGLGRELYRRSRVFASAWDAVAAHSDPYLDRPLARVAFSDESRPLAETPCDRAALLALEVALYRMLEAWGVKPDIVAAETAGEPAAAHVTGALSLPDACARVLEGESPRPEGIHRLSRITGEAVPAAPRIGTILLVGPGTEASAATRDRLGAAAFVPVLPPDTDEATAVARAVATTHAAGFPVDWNAYFSASRPRRVDLPTYAFQRKRYWLTASSGKNRLRRPKQQIPKGLYNMDNAAVNSQLRDYLKRVTAELSQTRQRLRAVEARASEPIAIVGMSCHYPGGVETPEDLWELVAQGRDEVTGFPQDRGWDLESAFNPAGRQPGTSYKREAGFLSDPAGFDAEFFGISDREALVMDPQHRLMLEAAWEAVEHAGIDPTSLAGTATGVFCGLVGQEYGPRYDQAAENLRDHLVFGNIGGTLPGRIAYTLGVAGPAMTVDTTSASSLAALYSAVRALRAGDCETALAGGACVLATPTIFTEHIKTGVLPHSGRTRSFAEAAEGMNFAEGAGMLLLERLSDAQRRNHRVLALIRGAAVNHAGSSNGVAAPNTPSIEGAYRRALADARLDPSEVDLAEGHGTATLMSTPIEIQALHSVYGRGRSRDNPLYLGSMKSNFGHSQAAAGVGGVIKMVMAMRHRLMPKTLHVDAPSSLADWSSGTVRLLTEARPWPESGHPRRACVSTFGASGTNGHVIVEEAPGNADGAGTPAPSRSLPEPVAPWLVSAKSKAALRAQAAKLLAHLDSHDAVSTLDVARSLAVNRTHFQERAAVVAADIAGFTHGLRDLANDEPAATIVRGTAAAGTLAFLFAGHVTDRSGLGRQLYRDSRMFAAGLDAVVNEMNNHLEQPLSNIFDGGATGIDEESHDRAALLAVDIALSRTFAAWGPKPDVTLGQAAGRLAAAHVAGALSLRNACALLGKPPPEHPDAGFAAFACGDGAEVPIDDLDASGITTVMDFASGSGRSDRLRETLQRGSLELVPVLRPGACESTSVATALMTVHVNGFPVDWEAYFSHTGARPVDLPTYAFQHRRYWLAPGTTDLKQAVSTQPY